MEEEAAVDIDTEGIEFRCVSGEGGGLDTRLRNALISCTSGREQFKLERTEFE